jgi:hypothetical protein
MKLSNQALTCIMVALQKSIMEQSDIVPILKGYNFHLDKEELFVKNPPSSMSARNSE